SEDLCKYLWLNVSKCCYEEPDALIGHVRFCEGGVPRGALLLDLASGLADKDELGALDCFFVFTN
ncbi:hypothetical protein, partial [Sporomusa sphaeroides]|uniref:hypothetical protein n=1 Tax=Sporomusa sphaeroides TaxID=47679 RepID=UPI001C62746D